MIDKISYKVSQMNPIVVDVLKDNPAYYSGNPNEAGVTLFDNNKNEIRWVSWDMLRELEDFIPLERTIVHRKASGYEDYCDFGSGAFNKYLEKHPELDTEEFTDYVIQYNKADRDSGELQDIAMHEIERLAEGFGSELEKTEEERMNDTLLFENEWLTIKETNDGYVYVDNIDGVIILPFKVLEDGGKLYLLRKESHPLHGMNITVIAGRTDAEDGDLEYAWIETAKRELKEEAGIDVGDDTDRLVNLGIIHLGKDNRFPDIMVAVDVTGLEQLEPATDGTKSEKESFNFWVTEGELKDYIKEEADSYLIAIGSKFFLRTASILDYPKPGLCPYIWNEDGTINSDVKSQILDKLYSFLADQGIDIDDIVDDVVEKIYIIGSLTSYQYNSKSDLDVHVWIDLQQVAFHLGHNELDHLADAIDSVWRKKLNVEEGVMVEGTEHPLEFYFEMEGITSSEPTDGIYDLLNGKWVKDPRTVDADFDVNEIYPTVINHAREILKEFDVNLGEIKRDIKDIELLQDTIRSFDGDRRKLFIDKLKEKIEEINRDILNIIEKGQEVIDDRKTDYNPLSDNNIKFKFAQRYGYIWLVKNLERAIGEDMRVEEHEIPNVKKVVEEGEEIVGYKVGSSGEVIIHQSVEDRVPNFDAYFGTEDFNQVFPQEFGKYEIKMLLPESETGKIVDLGMNVNKSKQFMVDVVKRLYPNDTDYMHDLSVGKEEAIKEFYEIWTDKDDILPVIRQKGLEGAKFGDEYILTKEFISKLQRIANDKNVISYRVGETIFENALIQVSEVSKDVVNKIKGIQSKIDESLLYKEEDDSWIENGLQKLFHVTILYGVDEDVIDDVKVIFDKYKPIKVVVNSIGYFDNKDEGYTVAYLGIDSEELKKFHNELRDKIENKHSYDYSPHITIAYLKLDSRLENIGEVGEFEWEIDEIELVDRKGSIHKIGDIYDRTHTDLYKMPIGELKANYVDNVVKDAITVWKEKGFSDDKITEKVEALYNDLQNISDKGQFIAVMKQYMRSRDRASFKRMGSYISYFYDHIGTIIGRIEVGDNGDSFAYNSKGELVGKTFEGKTFDGTGSLIAQSDILSSLLVKEDRVVTSYRIVSENIETLRNFVKDKFNECLIDKELFSLSNLIDFFKNRYSDNKLEFTDLEREAVIKKFLDERVIKMNSKNGLSVTIPAEEFVDTKEWIKNKVINLMAEGNSVEQTAQYLFNNGDCNTIEEAKELIRGIVREEYNRLGSRLSFKVGTEIPSVYNIDTDFFSVQLEELEGEEDIESVEVEPRKRYIPKLKGKGKFEINDKVKTPHGIGEVVLRQLEYRPYSYTVRMLETGELEVVEERDMRKISNRIKASVKDGVIKLDSDARVEVWVTFDDLEYHGDIKKIRAMDIDFEDKVERAKVVVQDIVNDKIKGVIENESIEITTDNITLEDDTIDWEKLFVDFKVSDRVELIETAEAKRGDDFIEVPKGTVGIITSIEGKDEYMMESSEFGPFMVYKEEIKKVGKEDYYFLKKNWTIITPAGSPHAEIEAPEGGTMWIEMDGESFWVKSSLYLSDTLGVGEFNKIYASFVKYVQENSDYHYLYRDADELNRLSYRVGDVDDMDEEITDGEMEPSPSDYIMSDSGTLGSKTSVSSEDGGFLGEFDTNDEALEAIKQDMEKNKIYSDVWQMSDHGNLVLVTHWLNKTSNKKKAWESVGWLRDLWREKSKEVLDKLVEKYPEFKEEVEDIKSKVAHLYNYYLTGRYQFVEDSYVNWDVDDKGGRELLDDLVYQFQTELYATLGLTLPKKEVNEKESYVDEELPAFGLTNTYPYSGTGANIGDSVEMLRIVDTPSKEVRSLN